MHEQQGFGLFYDHINKDLIYHTVRRCHISQVCLLIIKPVDENSAKVLQKDGFIPHNCQFRQKETYLYLDERNDAYFENIPLKKRQYGS